jgi:hypothetical protein
VTGWPAWPSLFRFSPFGSTMLMATKNVFSTEPVFVTSVLFSTKPSIEESTLAGYWPGEPSVPSGGPLGEAVGVVVFAAWSPWG